MILHRKNFSPGPGFGTMYTVSAEPMGYIFTGSNSRGVELRVNFGGTVLLVHKDTYQSSFDVPVTLDAIFDECSCIIYLVCEFMKPLHSFLIDIVAQMPMRVLHELIVSVPCLS
jgi:hypothetical protein